MPTPPATADTAITTKRPAFTLQLPDSAPVRETIAAIEAEQAKLQNWLAEKARLEKEITSYIEVEAGESADEARLQQIAGYRIRIEMAPHIEAKLKRDQEAAASLLFPLLKPFSEAIIQAGATEEAAWIAIVAAHIAPYAPTLTELGGKETIHARRLAEKFPRITIVPNVFGILRELQSPTASERESRYHNGTDADFAKRKVEDRQSDLRRAGKLLELHERIAKAGRFYHTPEEAPAVVKARIDKHEADERRTEAEKRAAEARFREETAAAQKAWEEKARRETAERLTPISRAGI